VEEVAFVGDGLVDELRALADEVQVRPLDVAALRDRLARKRRQRRLAGGVSLALAAALAVTAGALVSDVRPDDRLTSGEDGASYVRLIAEDPTLRDADDLPPRAKDCLTRAATPVPNEPAFGVLYELVGPLAGRERMVDCLQAVEGLRVLPQADRDFVPIGRTGAVTAEQAARPGVDATQECSAPGVRESAPPFEGEQPLQTAGLIAAYLTDEDGYAAWAWEYEGSLSFGNTPGTNGLVRLCWYRGDGEYQLVVQAVDGLVPNSNTRSVAPLPVLAPPPPQALSREEISRREVVYPQPEGVVVRGR
jgi:hypothetical protein